MTSNTQQGYDPASKKLEIVTTANQDPLLCESLFTCSRSSPINFLTTAHVPIIGIDIWEHVSQVPI